MALKEHLAIIEKGMMAWNSWREKSPTFQPSLKSSDLSDIDLCFANCNFARANLAYADFRSACLYGTIFIGNEFCGTDFTSVHLSNTVFVDVDLNAIIGLDYIRHDGPSVVDNHTLQRSRDVTKKFWRGGGLPDWQIEATKLYEPNLSQDELVSITYEIARIRGDQPIQLLSLFISYSSRDDGFARRLYDCLQSNGVRCWYAPEDMKIGDRIRSRIDQVIHIHDKLLLVLSEHSVASPWVEQEVVTAFAKEREEPLPDNRTVTSEF